MRIPARTIGLVLALMIANPAFATEQLPASQYPDLLSSKPTQERGTLKKLSPPRRVKTIPFLESGPPEGPTVETQDHPIRFRQNEYWIVLRFPSGERSDCYVRGVVHRKLPEAWKHGHIYFFLSADTEGEPLVPQLAVGYEMGLGTRIVLQVGYDQYVMMPMGKNAWVMLPDDRERVLEAMQQESEMVVHSRQTGRQNIQYEFDLRGLPRALEKLATCSAKSNAVRERQ